MKAWMLLFFAAFSGSVFSQSHLIEFKVEDKSIPCRIDLLNESRWEIVNGAERIPIEIKWGKDSTFTSSLPLFNTYFEGKKEKGIVTGEWVDPTRTGDYRIPFQIVKTKIREFDTKVHVPIHLKYKIVFEDDTVPAILNLEVVKEEFVTYGTVLTETGDYRYLQGELLDSNRFYLSAFDGTHLFYLDGRRLDNRIEGIFMSGKHYLAKFTGELDANFELRNADELTWMKHSKDVLKLKLDTDVKTERSFGEKDWKGKVTLVQIMGTWCPNCTDESRFVKSMYEKYAGKGLQVVPVSFERGTDKQVAFTHINSQAKQMALPYPVYLGSGAESPQKSAAIVFSQLNHVMSFPTLILIGKDGMVKKVWTGFYGPGTGVHYIEHTQEIEKAVEKELNR
ncbi:MAG: peroxiredoxin family protein [Sediminibacterium sp.]